jgi:hypothetical protein
VGFELHARSICSLFANREYRLQEST